MDRARVANFLFPQFVSAVSIATTNLLSTDVNQLYPRAEVKGDEFVSSSRKKKQNKVSRFVSEEKKKCILPNLFSRSRPFEGSQKNHDFSKVSELFFYYVTSPTTILTHD